MSIAILASSGNMTINLYAKFFYFRITGNFLNQRTNPVLPFQSMNQFGVFQKGSLGRGRPYDSWGGLFFCERKDCSANRSNGK